MTLAAVLAAAMLPRPRQAARRACRLPVAHSAAASTIQRKPWSARRDRPGRTCSDGQEPPATAPPGGGPVERRDPASQASSQVGAPAEAGCCQVGADGSSPCSAFMSCCSASCGSEVFSTVPP